MISKILTPRHVHVTPFTLSSLEEQSSFTYQSLTSGLILLPRSTLPHLGFTEQISEVAVSLMAYDESEKRA